MGQTLLVLFYSTNFDFKSIDSVIGIRTQDQGADESNELHVYLTL